jgi:shikimate kinase
MDVETTTPSAGEIEALVRRIDRPLVLVGMMGVGKSTVGRKLAALLGLAFVDADEEIERAAQMTIQEMFDTHGEPSFRDGERRVIARLIGDSRGGPRKVLATGGGAFADPETRALILDRAIAIWLDCDIDTLFERVSRKSNRPLLREGDPRATLERLRDQRAAAYAEAPIHVVSGRGPHHSTVLAIVSELDRWL